MLLWIEELIERFGDERVATTIELEAPRGDFGKLLGRVRDRLAREDAQHIRAVQPRADLSGREMLAVVRGEVDEPRAPYVYDTHGLTADEYGEFVLWAARRAGHAHPVTPAAPEPPHGSEQEAPSSWLE